MLDIGKDLNAIRQAAYASLNADAAINGGVISISNDCVQLNHSMFMRVFKKEDLDYVSYNEKNEVYHAHAKYLGVRFIAVLNREEYERNYGI